MKGKMAAASLDHERESTYSAAALAAMRREGVPPTPRNYELWYAYASHANPELTRTMDAVTAGKALFDRVRCEELYARFFGNDVSLDVFESAGSQIQATADKLMEVLGEAVGQTRDYGYTLDEASHAFADNDVERLREVVAGLVNSTTEMVARNLRLEKELNRSSSEIETLKVHLQEVQHEALTDGLTGIANRKRFETALREGVSQALESGAPLSLLFLDIDHFKRFNDTYGHPLGDQVIRLVAKTLTDSVGEADTPARYGGEEFAIVLPNTPLERAIKVAETIRVKMMRRKIVKRDTAEDMGSITLSIGVTSYVPGEPVAGMVQRADAALYQAKRGGRNRVVTQNTQAAAA